MGWFGLGKPRSRLGHFMDEHKIKQKDMEERTGLSDMTVSRLANDERWMPNRETANRVMEAVHEYDEDKTTRDFWEW